MQCANNLRQLTLAIHNFHDSHDRFPAASFDEIFVRFELRRFGYKALLLPFIEQSALYSTMVQMHDRTAAIGTDARSWDSRAKPSAGTLVNAFLCPSDGEGRSRWTQRVPSGVRSGSGEFQSFTNYRGSRGDLAGNDTHLSSGNGYDNDPDSNGIGAYNNFRSTAHHVNMPRSWLRSFGHTGGIGIVTSGTSNSVAFSEGLIAQDSESGGAPWSGIWGGPYKRLMAWGVSAHYNQVPQLCLNLKGAGGEFRNPRQETHWDVQHYLGRRAWCIWPAATQFYTLLPPNSPNCSSGYQYMWMSAASNHTGGVNVSFLDGSTRFVSDSIDVRNLNRRVRSAPSGTPDNPPAFPVDPDGNGFSYGVWAELGAINSIESVSL
jgi:prepilin-type processing-associated H-X9-DG protein